MKESILIGLAYLAGFLSCYLPFRKAIKGIKTELDKLQAQFDILFKIRKL